MSEEEEIEELRRRKMLELRAKLEEQQSQAEQRRQYEIQKKLAILQVLTPEARGRLANIRAVGAPVDSARSIGKARFKDYRRPAARDFEQAAGAQA